MSKLEQPSPDPDRANSQAGQSKPWKPRKSDSLTSTNGELESLRDAFEVRVQRWMTLRTRGSRTEFKANMNWPEPSKLQALSSLASPEQRVHHVIINPKRKQMTTTQLTPAQHAILPTPSNSSTAGKIDWLD